MCVHCVCHAHAYGTDTTTGTLDIWIPLTTSSGPGPPKPAGEIHCVFSFEGPLGVAYPQHQPGVDSFDDSLRVNLKVSESNDEGG